MWKRKEGEQERYVNRRNVSRRERQRRERLTGKKDTNGHHGDGAEGKPTDRDKEAGTQIESLTDRQTDGQLNRGRLIHTDRQTETRGYTKTDQQIQTLNACKNKKVN